MATRDVGTTQRPPSTALLTIDSEDRFPDLATKRASVNNSTAYNRSPYDFSLIRNASLVNGYMTRLAVSEVVFPWLIPNIDGQSDAMKINYVIGGVAGSGTVIITPGFYKPHDLATAVASSITTLVPALGFSMSYGIDNTPRFHYQVSPGNTVAFEPLPINVPPPLPGFPPQSPHAKQLFDILGFSMGGDINPGNNTQLVSAWSAMTLCQNNRYVDIVSPQLTANQGLPDATSQPVGVDSLCRLYLGDNNGNSTITDPSNAEFCPPGCAPTVIYRQFSTPKQIQWNTIMPVSGRIQFRVLDEAGYVLFAYPTYVMDGIIGWELYPNADWSMSLLLTEN